VSPVHRAAAPASELVDAEERRAIREDLGDTLFVEAAAGTGKTSALVSRIAAVLANGVTTLDRIAALTFTEKAAGEMKLRLRAEIERRRNADDTPAEERMRLDAALAQLEVARIATIHAFCADLLRERPIEAGVDPRFEVAREEESQALLEAAFERWFERALADPPEGVRRVLRRRARGFGAAGPRELLRRAAANLADHRDFPAAWRRPSFDRVRALDALFVELRELGQLAARAADPERDWLAKNLAEIDRAVSEIELRERVSGRDHDALEAELRELARSRQVHWHWKGSPRKPFARDLPRALVLERRDAAKAGLDALIRSCDADLAPLLREELRPVVEAYQLAKQRAGCLDFLDLLIRARDLLRDDASVQAAYRERLDRIFVDEFQDTDPLQAEILMRLASAEPELASWRDARVAPGKLFLVGDPKQSIYRFRRADLAIYETVKRNLAAQGARVLQLRASFRALPSLQRSVNAAFRGAMRGARDAAVGDGTGANSRSEQASYVALEPVRTEHADQPSLVALPVPRPYSEFGRITDWSIEKSLPDAVGAFVDWLVRESGWTVADREGNGARVPIAPRHICLLFRRFKSFDTDVPRPYVRALEARRVPHVLVGGRSFHDREEVQALRNACRAIEWPGDDLAVFATLRGPFVALGDDALLGWRQRVGSLHPLRRLSESELADLEPALREVADALALLGRLHLARNRRPIAATLTLLFEALRAHAGIAIWPTGEQALANCLRTIDVARRFERGGAASFRAFVRSLEREAERGEAQEAPVIEEGTEGVRIMTVHRAKGLEFPVVILCDPTCKATSGNASRHVDPERGLLAEPLAGCTPIDLQDAAPQELAREEEESVRIAYVAATRARDLLVVPVVGDTRLTGWLGVLGPALHPPVADQRRPELARGCPRFGDDSVLERPPRAEAESLDSVRPGLHRAEAGSEVVWWDPRALALDREESVGLRQQRMLEADASGAAAEAGVRAHAQWQEGRQTALAAGARPSVRVESVTRASRARVEAEGGAPLARANERALEPVRREATDVDRSARPGGRRFGSLVHASLAAVPLAAPPEQIERVVVAQARLFGSSAAERDAAQAAVASALAHPLLQRAARASELRRETPVLLREGDGALIEGVVDLAFCESTREGARWTVIDFKTDRELSAARGAYEEQATLYARAISAATKSPCDAVLLSV
jgi:ATP-dependent exoDNAse (exonuclease V) beta subunit